MDQADFMELAMSFIPTLNDDDLAGIYEMVMGERWKRGIDRLEEIPVDK